MASLPQDPPSHTFPPAYPNTLSLAPEQNTAAKLPFPLQYQEGDQKRGLKNHHFFFPLETTFLNTEIYSEQNPSYVQGNICKKDKP